MLHKHRRTSHQKKIFEIYLCVKTRYATSVARTQGNLKEYGHLKYLYCEGCKRNHNLMNVGRATPQRMMKYLISAKM